MGIQMTAIDERHFRPDPEGKRKFVLHDWPPADIATTREFDLARSQAATSNAFVSEAVASERGALALLS